MLSDEMRRFILTSVPSVAWLEAALQFRRDPAASHTVADIARALYVGEAHAAEVVRGLHAAGWIEPAPAGEGFRHAPRDAALAEQIDELAAQYRTDMIGVTRLIHDATQRSAQRFADAFKLRKDS